MDVSTELFLVPGNCVPEVCSQFLDLWKTKMTGSSFLDIIPCKSSRSMRMHILVFMRLHRTYFISLWDGFDLHDRGNVDFLVYLEQLSYHGSGDDDPGSPMSILELLAFSYSFGIRLVLIDQADSATKVLLNGGALTLRRQHGQSSLSPPNED